VRPWAFRSIVLPFSSRRNRFASAFIVYLPWDCIFESRKASFDVFHLKCLG
jgi:hypothetical protein